MSPNELQKQTVGAWVVALLFVSVILGMGLWIYPTAFPYVRTELARAVILKGTLIPFVCFIGAAFLAFLNKITGPDWFDCIGRNPYAVAIFASCVWIGIVALAIFT